MTRSSHSLKIFPLLFIHFHSNSLTLTSILSTITLSHWIFLSLSFSDQTLFLLNECSRPLKRWDVLATASWPKNGFRINGTVDASVNLGPDTLKATLNQFPSSRWSSCPCCWRGLTLKNLTDEKNPGPVEALLLFLRRRKFFTFLFLTVERAHDGARSLMRWLLCWI